MRRVLAHPLTRGLELDDPRTTQLRRQIIQEKPFLRRIYEEWYAALESCLPSVTGGVLELGSGAGFLSEFIPDVITSEVFFCPGTSVVLDGQALPFQAADLSAIVMTNVFHHLQQPRRFLSEAARCIHPGGAVAMIEPWVTPWSRLIYTRLHHEPLWVDAGWEVPVLGPLSGANSALPWIIFERDRSLFVNEFPQWRIQTISLMMPFRYLVSGGVSLRNLMPAFTFETWHRLERIFQPQMKNLAMFALIVLQRTGLSKL